MSMRRSLRGIAAMLVLLSAGCAAVDPPTAPPPVVRTVAAEPAAAPVEGVQGVPYACDNGLTLHARFGEGTVTIAGLPQGDELLLRDAGGVTPEQTVWSNERLRAELGLAPVGQGAALHLLQPQAATVICRRQ